MMTDVRSQFLLLLVFVVVSLAYGQPGFTTATDSLPRHRLVGCFRLRDASGQQNFGQHLTVGNDNKKKCKAAAFRNGVLFFGLGVPRDSPRVLRGSTERFGLDCYAEGDKGRFAGAAVDISYCEPAIQKNYIIVFQIIVDDYRHYSYGSTASGSSGSPEYNPRVMEMPKPVQALDTPLAQRWVPQQHDSQAQRPQFAFDSAAVGPLPRSRVYSAQPELQPRYAGLQSGAALRGWVPQQLEARTERPVVARSDTAEFSVPRPRSTGYPAESTLPVVQAQWAQVQDKAVHAWPQHLAGGEDATRVSQQLGGEQGPDALSWDAQTHHPHKLVGCFRLREASGQQNFGDHLTVGNNDKYKCKAAAVNNGLRFFGLGVPKYGGNYHTLDCFGEREKGRFAHAKVDMSYCGYPDYWEIKKNFILVWEISY